jgi:hypothetical protein
MTKSFTPPGGAGVLADCAKSAYNWYQHSAIDWVGPINASTCMPPDYDPRSTAYYSPGLFCPVGYLVAATSTIDDQAVTYCCPA